MHLLLNLIVSLLRLKRNSKEHMSSRFGVIIAAKICKIGNTLLDDSNGVCHQEESLSRDFGVKESFPGSGIVEGFR